MSDAEFGQGRGRNHDSSSSRDSSPHDQPRKKQRPLRFSPQSDDGDGDTEITIPPIADDDTPPPPDRPLLRQAVGFGSIATGTVTTYQAQLPQTSKASAVHYLPGQAPVQIPPKPKKRKKKNDQYQGQAGRFRLDPNFTPASFEQSAPSYASFFTGIAEPSRSESPGTGLSSGTITDSTMTDTSNPAATRKSTRPSASRSGRRTTGSTKKAVSQSSQRHQLPPQGVLPQITPQPLPVHSAIREPITKSPQPDPQPSEVPSNQPLEQTTSTSYYRRDYDNRPRQHIVSGPSSISDSSMAPDPTNEGRNTNRKLRMITILAQDIRSGVIDKQLIEIMVPLRAADNRQDGFWANAVDIIGQWQKSPARVDGPARVYTLRGEYRQILLRVDKANVDSYMATNVVVTKDRTVEVVIEPLPTPGVLPSAPVIPPELLEDPDDYDGISVDDRGTPASPSPTANPVPIENSSNMASRPSDPTTGRVITSGPIDPIHEYRQVHGPEASAPVRRLRPDQRGYETPDSEDEPGEVEKKVSKAVEKVLQKDSQWSLFFQWQGNPEQTAPIVLNQYRFVKRQLDEYVGQCAPFETKEIVIEDRHIISALYLTDENEDGKYVSNVKEVLGLLSYYGKGGQRYENQEVIMLAEDSTPPVYNSKPVKRLLHLLREVDAKWKAENPKGKGVDR